MASACTSQSHPHLRKPPDPQPHDDLNARSPLEESNHVRPMVAAAASIPMPSAAKPSYTAAASTPIAASARPSYASLVSKPKPRARLPDVPLPARQYGLKDGVPSVAFTKAEHQALAQRFRHTIIAKFQIGRPSLQVIRDFILTNWRIKGTLSMSTNWDDRHIVVILDSEEDVNAALTCPSRKIQHAYFRLFRWSVGYNPKKETTTITKWIRLPGLPMEYFTRSGIKAIVSSFAYFLDLDDRTYELNSLHVARACVELDITQPIPARIWIQVGDEGFYQDVIVEGNISYCMKCKLHGHDLSTCKKAAKIASKKLGVSLIPIPEKSDKGPQVPSMISDYGPDNLAKVTIPAKPIEEWKMVTRKKAVRGRYFSSDSKNKGDTSFIAVKETDISKDIDKDGGGSKLPIREQVISKRVEQEIEVSKDFMEITNNLPHHNIGNMTTSAVEQVISPNLVITDNLEREHVIIPGLEIFADYQNNEPGVSDIQDAPQDHTDLEEVKKPESTMTESEIAERIQYLKTRLEQMRAGSGYPPATYPSSSVVPNQSGDNIVNVSKVPPPQGDQSNDLIGSVPNV